MRSRCSSSAMLASLAISCDSEYGGSRGVSGDSPYQSFLLLLAYQSSLLLLASYQLWLGWVLLNVGGWLGWVLLNVGGFGV